MDPVGRHVPAQAWRSGTWVVGLLASVELAPFLAMGSVFHPQ